MDADAHAPSEDDGKRLRAQRLRRVHTRTVPVLRLLGLNLLVVGVVLHNAWILGDMDWSLVLAYAGFAELYALATWWVLDRWYDPRARLDLGLVFLVLDLVPWALAVAVAGGTDSWIFWIFLFRVADQTSTRFRRALGFTALGTAAYLAVVLWTAATGGTVAWPAEAAKLIFLLMGGTYISITARTAEQVRDRLRNAVRVARRSVEELRAQSSELERAREQAEAGSRAKSAFLSRVSHELRTPMNAILGFAQLLEMEPGLTKEQRTYLDEIMGGGRHLLDIINEVLDIARVETGSLAHEMEPVAVDGAMAEVLERARPAAERRSVALPATPPPGSAIWVCGSPRKVRQVFANLVSNAIKYNSSPGRVTLDCEVREGRVRVSVTDTGAGIPADRIEDAFTPFDRLGAEQHEMEGTGLGLSVARSLVRAMDGDIGVDTRPGEGSTFWFELELAEAPDEVEAGTARPVGTGPLILYIDDKPENLMLVRRILERRPGVELLSAPLGMRGIQEARIRRPDLILLDMELPDIPGREVLGRLRADAETRDIPVVMVSAEASRVKVERLLADGARAYFTMPYDVAKFLDMIDEILPTV